MDQRPGSPRLLVLVSIRLLIVEGKEHGWILCEIADSSKIRDRGRGLVPAWVISEDDQRALGIDMGDEQQQQMPSESDLYYGGAEDDTEVDSGGRGYYDDANLQEYDESQNDDVRRGHVKKRAHARTFE